MSEYKCILKYNPHRFPCECCTKNDEGIKCLIGNTLSDEVKIESTKKIVLCSTILCTNMGCVHRRPHEQMESCGNVCNNDSNSHCVAINNEAKAESKCELHGQNIEIEVLNTWVYPKSKIIELRCIDICKQCGESYGSVYAIFADKFVKEE